MVQAIKMDMDDMQEILDALPEELRNKIIKKLKPDLGIFVLTQFVEQYEDDNVMDYILAQAMSNLIRKITKAAKGLSKTHKQKGKNGLSTIELVMIVIECMKDETTNMQNALDHHEKECTKGDDCGAKH